LANLRELRALDPDKPSSRGRLLLSTNLSPLSISPRKAALSPSYYWELRLDKWNRFPAVLIQSPRCDREETYQDFGVERRDDQRIAVEAQRTIKQVCEMLLCEGVEAYRKRRAQIHAV
jgi:hypothetical protein